MSDTPRTDAVKIACGFQAVPQSFLEHAEQLELDNDELRKAHHKYESTLHDLRSVLEVTTLESFVQAAQRLKRENAALREDKERLDLLLTNKHCKLSFCWEWLHWTPQQVRCALDAERVKRKEAQP